MATRTRTDKIIWHCTATPEGREVTKEDLFRWHVVENGWNDIGYHYLIQLDGTVVPCRPEHLVGAHCKGENSYSVGIAYAGGVMNDGTQRAKDTRTDEQMQALYELTSELLEKYNLQWDDVYGHNQFAAKACPSFDVPNDVENYQHADDDEVDAGDPEPNMPDLGNPNLLVVDLTSSLSHITLRLDRIERDIRSFRKEVDMYSALDDLVRKIEDMGKGE